MPCVLVVGTLCSGYRAYGPFPDLGAAQDFYYANEPPGDWHIMELQPAPGHPLRRYVDPPSP